MGRIIVTSPFFKSSGFKTYTLHAKTKSRRLPPVRAGVHMKAAFWLGTMVLMQISRLRGSSSQESLCSSHISMLCAVL